MDWTKMFIKKLIEIFNLSDKEYVDTMGMNEGNHEEDDGFVWAQMRMTRLVRLKQPGRWCPRGTNLGLCWSRGRWDGCVRVAHQRSARGTRRPVWGHKGPGGGGHCHHCHMVMWLQPRGEKRDKGNCVLLGSVFRHYKCILWLWASGWKTWGIQQVRVAPCATWGGGGGGVPVAVVSRGCAGARVAAPARRPAPPPAHQPGHSFSNCCLVPVVTALSAATESQRTSSAGQNINTDPRPQQRQSQWHHGGLHTPPAGGLPGPPVCEGGRAPGQDPPQQCLLSAAKIQTQQTCRHEDILPNRGMYILLLLTSVKNVEWN